MNNQELNPEEIKAAWVKEVGTDAFETTVKSEIDNLGWMMYDEELYGECRSVFEIKEMRDTSFPFEITYFIRPKTLKKEKANV